MAEQPLPLSLQAERERRETLGLSQLAAFPLLVSGVPPETQDLAQASQTPARFSDALSPAPGVGSAPRRREIAPALPAAASSELLFASPPPVAAAEPGYVQTPPPPSSAMGNM